MTSDTMNQVVRLTWVGYGIFIDEESPGTDPPYIKFSVPEHSFHHNANGIEMAGDFLAKRIKQTAIESGFPANTRFMYKIRQGDNWTEGNKNQAEVAMRACFQTGDSRPFDLFRQNHAKEWSSPASEGSRMHVRHSEYVTGNSSNGYTADDLRRMFNEKLHANESHANDNVILDVTNYAEDHK